MSGSNGITINRALGRHIIEFVSPRERSVLFVAYDDKIVWTEWMFFGRNGYYRIADGEINLNGWK